MKVATCATIVAAFRDGRTTPSALARAVIEASRAARRRTPNLDPFVAIDEERAMKDAARADARWQAGAPFGALDGVPIAVKDHVDCAGLPTWEGTGYRSGAPVAHDAFLVAGLKKAGAIVVGKLHQHELGLGATGINMHWPVPRNPHDVTRAPGGSSSGSAQAVAFGLVPLTVAADGGGSIRIPSSLCGTFGIKATFGRLSRTNTGLEGGTMSSAGPIASSVADLDDFLRATCANDPRDLAMISAPPLDLAALNRARRCEGPPLRVGVIDGEIADADPDVARAVEGALNAAERAGLLRRVAVKIPSMRHARAIGYVTFGVECAAAYREDLSNHRSRIGFDVRLILALGEHLAGADFLIAQRHRAVLQRDVAHALADVDLLALPSTACTAPPIRPTAEQTGEVDEVGTAKLTRYTFMANLTGLPAASFPIGADPANLPIGLQLVAPPFSEPTLLRAGYSLERAEIAHCPLAKHRLSLLPSPD